MLIQLIRPEWLTLQLSHLAAWIRVDTIAMLSFVVSSSRVPFLEINQRDACLMTRGSETGQDVQKDECFSVTIINLN